MTLLDTLIEAKWALLASIVTIYLLRKILRYQKLARFGGPPGTGFSEVPHSINAYTGEAHNWYRNVSEKYGMPAHLCP